MSDRVGGTGEHESESLLPGRITRTPRPQCLVCPSAASASPSWTYSYYVSSLDLGKPYTAGCNQGKLDLARAGTQSRVAILHFGDPARNSAGTYGVSLTFTNGAFASREQIKGIAVEFANGYWTCTGSDTTSSLEMALGVTNAGSEVANNAYQQGRAWTNFVNLVRGSLGPNYSKQVTVTGATDMELGYNQSGDSISWVDGYQSLNYNYYYDYGDVAGCPISGRTPCYPKQGNTGYYWPFDAVYQKLDGKDRAQAFPQNYNEAGTTAKQLANMSRYRYNNTGTRIDFIGTLSQYQACIDNGQSCTGTMNTPDEAWQLLVNELYNSGPNIQMNPQYSDNIRSLKNVTAI